MEPGDRTWDVLNICFPYSDSFVRHVRDYQKRFHPKCTIINSTVKVGTTRQIGGAIVHSPVNGRHPHLADSIRAFTKPIGALKGEHADMVAQFFLEAGVCTTIFDSPESTELAKVLCTAQFGWHLVLMKEIERICREQCVPFDEVYSEWNRLYNAGYHSLNQDRFARPLLEPSSGPIGGHCVIPNCDLLPDFITETIKARNERYKKSG
jgi:hypothetical protein